MEIEGFALFIAVKGNLIVFIVTDFQIITIWQDIFGHIMVIQFVFLVLEVLEPGSIVLQIGKSDQVIAVVAIADRSSGKIRNPFDLLVGRIVG